MSRYRHVGTYTQFLDTKIVLKRFGQQVEMDDALAAGHPSLRTEAEFQSYGFTEEELKKFPTVASHVDAPDDFLAKRVKAWSGSPPPPVETTKVEDTKAIEEVTEQNA